MTVDFEELNLRLRSYLPEEKVSYDQFKSGTGPHLLLQQLMTITRRGLSAREEIR